MEFSFPANITLDDIVSEIQATYTRQEELDKNLELLLSSREELEKQIDTATFPVPELGSISSEMHNLVAKVSQSSVDSIALSSRIRQLDEAQSRLQNALDRVDAVLDLKSTIEKVEDAMKREDYAAAANDTHRVLYLNKPVKNDVSFQVLLRLEEQLHNVIVAKCEQATERKDWRTVLSTSSLFPLLAIPFEGLKLYCHAARKSLATKLEEKGMTLSSQPPGAVVSFMELLSDILNLTASHVREHAKRIGKLFGSGMQLRLVQEITQEVDAQLVPILRRFIKDNDLVSLSKKVRRSLIQHNNGDSGSSGTISGVNAGLEARALDSLLDEMSYLSSESEAFDLSLRQLGTKAQNKLKTIAESVLPPLPGSNSDNNNNNTDDNNNNNDVTSPESKSDPNQNNVHGGGRHEGKDTAQVAADNSDISSSPHQDHNNNSNDNNIVLKDKHGNVLSVEQIRKKHLQRKRTQLVLEAMLVDPMGNELVHCSKTNEVMQEIIGHYIALEEYYMIQNIHKAIRMDSYFGRERKAKLQFNMDGNDGDGKSKEGEKLKAIYDNVLIERLDGNLTSTMVDDVFFILKKCTQRAFATANFSSACATLNHVNALLGRGYRQKLETVTQQYGAMETPTNEPNLARMFQSGDREKKRQRDVQFLLALNNLDVSNNHLLTLKSQLQEAFQDIFAQHPGANQNLITLGLSELKETSIQFKRVAKKGINTIVKVISPKFRPLLDKFIQIDYELRESHYTDRQIQDPFVQGLATVLDFELESLKECLTPTNFQTLVATLVYYISTRLETMVMKKRFSFWGGLQLDKDIRKLSTFFSSISNLSVAVREKFGRLVQIASILQLDKPSELLDYWGEGAGQQVWKLHEAEIRKILALRVEFSSREIAQLRL